MKTGIVSSRNRKLAYGYKHGLGISWMPNYLQHIVVHNWNFVMCRIFGHNWMPDFDELYIVLEETDTSITYDWSTVQHRVCGDCCKRERLYTIIDG